MAGATGLEPATPGSTVRYSDQIELRPRIKKAIFLIIQFSINSKLMNDGITWNVTSSDFIPFHGTN